MIHQRTRLIWHPRRAPARRGDDLEDDDSSGVGNDLPRIRCPKCRWQPKRSDRWSCLCGHAWNTFETEGRCPACAHQWLDTACLACSKWSPHGDWYAE